MLRAEIRLLAYIGNHCVNMIHSPSSLSPAEALFRVVCRSPTSLTITRSLLHRSHTNSRSKATAQTRYASFMRSRSNVPSNLSKAPPRPSKDQFPGVIRNNAIEARYIQMPAPEGGLTPAEPLRSVLSRLKEGTEHLVQISKMDDGDDVAICRIMTLSDLLLQKRDKEKAQKELRKSVKQAVPKQIELNWAIGPNDLEHKLTQLKSFIEDGKKVEVVLARRKKKRQATMAEGEELMKKVRTKLEEIDAREIKPMEGREIGKHIMLTVRKRGLD